MSGTIRRSVTIINQKGLHARASAKLAKLALTLPATVNLSHAGETADARSIMDLLCLGASCGDAVALSAEGEGASEAMDSVLELFMTGFGELDDQA
ncbi:MAG: HPr family phosphocarrier protein [Henriciella sp.]